MNRNTIHAVLIGTATGVTGAGVMLAAISAYDVCDWPYRWGLWRARRRWLTAEERAELRRRTEQERDRNRDNGIDYAARRQRGRRGLIALARPDLFSADHRGIPLHQLTARQLLTEIGYAVAVFRQVRTREYGPDSWRCDGHPAVRARSDQLRALRAEYDHRTDPDTEPAPSWRERRTLRRGYWLAHDTSVDHLPLPLQAAAPPRQLSPAADPGPLSEFAAHAEPGRYPYPSFPNPTMAEE